MINYSMTKKVKTILYKLFQKKAIEILIDYKIQIIKINLFNIIYNHSKNQFMMILILNYHFNKVQIILSFKIINKKDNLKMNPTYYKSKPEIKI